MTQIFFFFYHGCWLVGLFLARRLQNKLPAKARNYLLEREIPHLTWRSPARPNQRRIWFHAASGEVEYIRPLLRLWKAEHPDDLIFLTYFSTSARSMLSGISEIDGWAPLPFDLPDPCERFIKTLNPEILIIARTDLWPTILKKMNSRPKILVASTWAEGSKKTRGLGRLMSRWCLKYLNKVCVVSEADELSLKSVSPLTHSVITGDPRFDQVYFRLAQHRKLPQKIDRWRQSRFLVIAGSTWPEDEAVLLRAWQAARQASAPRPEVNNPCLLLVPHEIDTEHLLHLKQLCTSLNIPFSVWSELTAERTLKDVVVFDQKGWLADLYAIADFAFIGGSFKKQVHSVMEGLGSGLPIIVGPYYKNNREAIEFSQIAVTEFTMVSLVNDETSLTTILKQFLNLSPTAVFEIKSAVRREFLTHCQATLKTYLEIAKLMRRS
jgi:3-deoxy-D-manno-octulosonic-acid transferase